MPVLIDGYNLYHYVRGLYREEEIDLAIPAFCRVLDEWTRRARQKVTVVFDGAAPPPMRQNQTRFGALGVRFAGPGAEADAIIENLIADNTAPRLLTVVSSDRRIRRAAKRRGCKIQTSDEFWLTLAHRLAARKTRPEPREKTSGILDYEREYWLKIFGLK